MTEIDPFEMLKTQRPDAPPIDSVARDTARQRMLAGPGGGPARPRARRRMVIGGAAVALGCAIVLAVALRPGSGTDSAMAAAVARLADVAEHQRQIDANGKNQYVVSYYRTRTSWKQNLTQARLDELTRNQVAIINLRRSGGMGRIVYSKSLSPAEMRKQKRDIARVQARADARVRAGVRIEDLPTRNLEATITTRQVAYRDRAGAGGAGGLRHGSDGRPKYGSKAQARAAAILQRAQIGGTHANPTMWGGFELSAGPTFDAPRPAIVKSLSSDQTELRRQLERLEPTGLASPGTKPAEDTEVFTAVAAIVGSPYAPPKVRAAAIRLAAGLPGVTAAPATDERGRAGLGLTQPLPGGSKRLIFEETDARLLGVDVQISDPSKFGGPHWAGAGKSRIRIIPVLDSGSVSTSYDPWIVTRGTPLCRATFCPRKLKPVQNP